MKIYRMEDLQILGRIGRSVPTGTYEITRIGTRRQRTIFQETFKTRVGEFIPDKWYEIVRLCIMESGSEKLLDSIANYCATHCAWLKTEKERKEYAMDILVGRIYRYWKEFSVEGLAEDTCFVFVF